MGFKPPDERLAVPRFSLLTNGGPRGDRFHPPELEPEDFLRLRRNLEADARRRRVFLARRLDIYVDGTKQASFDPRQTPHFQFEVRPEADVLEVRGQDAEGELTLAVLLLRCYWIPPGESSLDWVILEGGQKLTVQLTPIRDASGEVEQARVDVRYAETRPIRAVARLAQRAWFGVMDRTSRSKDGSGSVLPRWSWGWTASLAVALMVVAATLIWYRLQPVPELPTPPRAKLPQPPELERVIPMPPVPPPSPEETPVLIARATWSTDPAAALRAIRIEPPRSQAKTIDLSQREATLLLRLPMSDEANQAYSRYRVTLVAQGKSIWQQTLRAPKPAITPRAHILSLSLFSRRLPVSDSYHVQVEGETQGGWQPLGHVQLDPVGR
jgi:hypothetical protein